MKKDVIGGSVIPPKTKPEEELKMPGGASWCQYDGGQHGM